MQSSIYRVKLLNAVLFFASNTKHVNITKLSKLLYFLDFLHFENTGYPSIGLEYFAFEKGPVPKYFWLEIKDAIVPEDFQGKVALIPNPNNKEVEIRAIGKPDLSVFSSQEIKILKRLAEIYKDAKAWQASEVAHSHGEPWDITVKEKGKNKSIDYLLSIDKNSPISLEDAEESLREHQEIIRNFNLSPTE